MLDSDLAIRITEDLIPGDLDNQIRRAIVMLLKTFKPILEAATLPAARKAIAARVAAELTAAQDQHRERMGTYSIIVEQVYQTEFKPA